MNVTFRQINLIDLSFPKELINERQKQMFQLKPKITREEDGLLMFSEESESEKTVLYIQRIYCGEIGAAGLVWNVFDSSSFIR